MFRLQRMVKDLLKQLQGQDSGQWANNKVSGLDRTLGEISRILEKQVKQKKKKWMPYHWNRKQCNWIEDLFFINLKSCIVVCNHQIAFIHLHPFLECSCLELFELYTSFILICKLVFAIIISVVIFKQYLISESGVVVYCSTSRHLSVLFSAFCVGLQRLFCFVSSSINPTFCSGAQVMPALWHVCSVMSYVWLCLLVSHHSNAEYHLPRTNLPLVIG